MLALRVILNQGVQVKAVTFWTPFFSKDLSPDALAANTDRSVKLPPILEYVRALGCDVEAVDLSDSYLDMLHNPRFGYGKNVNPCIDCHILMFETARRILEAEGFQFVFTGEVVGQRPKSQHMGELRLIARESGLEDRLVRPMSAQLLPITLPEMEGWLDRNRLFDFHGRTRKPQMELAKKYGIQEYPTPAGGCILTDPVYGNRVKDMWTHRGKEGLRWDDYMLLRIGRHLRTETGLKVVVGRHEMDNNLLEGFVKGRKRIEAVEEPGPVILIDADADVDAEITAARICARYCKKGREGSEIDIEIKTDDNFRVVRVAPFKPEETEAWLIR